jgi:hypothetical protein
MIKELYFVFSVRRIMVSVVVRYLILIYLLEKYTQKYKRKHAVSYEYEISDGEHFGLYKQPNLLRCQNADKRTVQTNGDV